VNRQVIIKLTKNIFDAGELKEKSVCSKMKHTGINEYKLLRNNSAKSQEQAKGKAKNEYDILILIEKNKKK